MGLGAASGDPFVGDAGGLAVDVYLDGGNESLKDSIHGRRVED
jgi:hypothetical protein